MIINQQSNTLQQTFFTNYYGICNSISCEYPVVLDYLKKYTMLRLFVSKKFNY